MNKMLELIRILNQLLYLSSMKQNMFQCMKIWTDKWRDAGKKQKQYKKNQIKITELKNTTVEDKNALSVFNSWVYIKAWTWK